MKRYRPIKITIAFNIHIRVTDNTHIWVFIITLIWVLKAVSNKQERKTLNN